MNPPTPIIDLPDAAERATAASPDSGTRSTMPRRFDPLKTGKSLVSNEVVAYERAPSRAMDTPSISVVIPAYNESECLEATFVRVSDVLRGLKLPYEILFVNDGSSDGTEAILERLGRRDPHVCWISFARNFGHEAASTAGLYHCRGDVVVLMDADLQDPPELIPEMLARWRQGFDVVYGQRNRRGGETWFKRATAWVFYRALNTVARVNIPRDTGDFRLMDLSVVAAFRALGERNRFVRGMIAWLGFRSCAIHFDRPARERGTAKYNLFKLAALSLDAVVGFSNVPLRIATFCGMVAMLLSLVAGAAVLVHKLFFGLAVPGYALLACGFFFASGVQMSLLGIVGEYIGRIYSEVQRRPLYIIQRQHGLDPAPSAVQPA